MFNSKKLMKNVNCENVLICVLVIVLVVLVIYYVNKNNEGFDNKGVLYFFYVDWCPHCTTAKPVISKLEQDSAVNSKVEIKRVNCEGSAEEKALAEQHNVRGFPTVVYVNNGENKELEGGVSESGIKSLIGA
jgi:thioredoxin-like negative regulator of GroEL